MLVLDDFRSQLLSLEVVREVIKIDRGGRFFLELDALYSYLRDLAFHLAPVRLYLVNVTLLLRFILLQQDYLL